MNASRILVIDDNRAIHHDFRKIFGTSRSRPTPSAAELALLGGGESAGAPEFQVDSAYQGEEGLALVRRAQEEDHPYAMAFVDVRMPPGWDGIETTAQIWRHDPDIQIVICTAFSDYSWSEMLAKLGRSDRLVILKKPFDTIEVLQLASALSEKWRLARESRSILQGLERRVAERTRELVQSVDELRRSESLKGAILESSLDCVVTIDHEGKIVEFNPAAEATFGLSRALALGQEMVELIVPPRLREAHRRGFAHYLATGVGPILGKRLELQAMRADGSEFPIELAINALRATSEPMFTGFIRDITARKEADKKIRRLNRVYAVLSGINTLIVRVRDRSELFREACRIAIEAGGFRMAWIGLMDREAGIVRPAASAGEVGNFFETAPLAITETRPGGHGLAGRAMRDKTPVISNDVHSDPQRMMKRELAERGIHSLAILPLLVVGEAIGVLSLYSTDVGFFDDEEMRLLLELAGDIAFAIGHIDKAEKLERMTRMNAMLSGINGAIVRIRSRQELFQEACRIAVETAGLPFAWLCVVDEAEMCLRPVASAGPDEGFMELIGRRFSLRDDAPGGHGISAQSIRERRAVVVNDIETAANISHQKVVAERGIKSVAILPLFIAGRAVGIFGLYAAQVDFFDADEMKLLNEVAANIAFALEHIEKEESVRRLTRVYAVRSGINALIVRVRDRGELFREACRIAVQSGQFALAWVAVADPRDQQVKAVAWAGDERGFVQFTRPTGGAQGQGKAGLSAQAMERRLPVVCNDIEADGSAMRYAKEALERGYRSAAALPLVVGGRPIGALVLYAAEAGFFDDEEIGLLQELAADISFAVDHLEKEQKVRRLTRVQAVLSGINALIVRVRERDTLLAQACRIAVEEGGLPMAWVGIVDRSLMQIAVVASAGLDQGLLGAIKDRLASSDGVPLGNNMAARAVRQKKAEMSNDAQNDPALVLSSKHVESGIRSMAMLPLIVADEAVGVLGLYSEATGFFDEEEMKLLGELAGDIAFALENIAGQQKLENLSRIRAVSSEINAAIVRVREREGLLRETGRIAVEHGKFQLVWIATLEREAQTVRPVVWTGFSAEAAHGVSWQNIAATRGTLGEAIQTRKPAVRNDIQVDLPGGGLRQEAVRKGCRSTVTLPLVVDDEVVALISLFAQGVGFFDAKELALLNEVAADVSFALQAIEKHEELEYLSYYDALTGLANRKLFLERVAQYMRSAVGSGHKLAVFFVDLERFRNINDSLGRPAGDALLKQVAEWLTRKVGDANLVSRMGADHFAVVLPQVNAEGNVAGLVEKAAAAFIEHPFHLNEAVFRIALKVGVAIFPDDGADADTLFKNAEAALKKAKAGGDRCLFYEPQMTDKVAGKLTLENQLRQALDREEFVLHYQPKVNLVSGKLTGAEALIRWNDPQTGLVPPGRFIPVLEETGLIYDVGRWALRRALADYLRWRAAGLAAVRIAVNVSPMQLRNRGFVAEIRQAIGIDAHAAAGLELEITESLIMEDVKHNIASLQAIREMGVRIAIDDFGTGFSSLSYLAKLPVHTLKIDRSFVIDMTLSPEGLALVSTIITLAHSIKLKVVAEGVETEEQSRLLRLLSCDEMQGYLFSKPVPDEVFEAKFLAGAVAVAA